MIGTRNVISYPGGKVLIPSQCDSLAENAGELPDEWAESVLQLYPLGSLLIVGEKKYRYCRADGTAPGFGVPSQSAAAQHADADAALAIAVTNAVGDLTISITGTTNLTSTADYYKEGFITVDSKTAGAQVYKVLAHPALNAAATKVITLQEAVRIILTAATDTVGLIQNPWDRVIASAAVVTGAFIGVPQIIPTNNYYFWIQSGGPAAVLANGTIALGTEAVIGTSAGEADPASAATTELYIGGCITVGAANKYCMVMLNVD